MQIIWGLLLVILGVLFLGDSLDWFHFDFFEFVGDAWPVVLIIFGGYLIWEKAKGRDESEDILSADKAWTKFSGKEFKKTAGDVNLRPESIDPAGLKAEQGLGDITVDLTKTSFNPGENQIHCSLGVGDINVVVPQGVPISAIVEIGAGSGRIFGRQTDGFGKKVRYEDPDYASADVKIRLRAKIGLGDATISRS